LEASRIPYAPLAVCLGGNMFRTRTQLILVALLNFKWVTGHEG
jgi:hypothetical protein